MNPFPELIKIEIGYLFTLPSVIMLTCFFVFFYF